MSSTFWSNTIWYILLLMTSIFSIILTLYKTQNLNFTIAFLFSVIGFTFVIEAVLTIGFNAYTYHPKIVSDLFLDAVFGNYFSQISISSTSLLITIFNLSHIWYLIFALIYYLIEEFFVKLGIFEHFWYKSIYTFLGLFPFLGLIKKGFEKAKDSKNRVINYILLFLSVFTINSLSIILSQRLLCIQIFKGNLFADMSKDHTTTGLIYQFFEINLLIILYKFKLHWVVKTMAFICLFIVQYLLYSEGFIYIPKGLFFTVTSLDLIGCYCWIAVFNYLLSKRTP
ncbi:MAG: hypothetical protein P4M12_06490 [Gammaproteobacteria bacterium]|nr:hypothetical protein [Gammaproteobacteria bacterium]